MGSLRRVQGQAEQSQIATAAVSYDKERLIIQTAVATLPPTLQYKVYTTAYGTPPVVTITFAGTTSRNQAGTARLSFDVVRSRPGSFQWIGTPNVRARWTAIGNRA